MSKCVFINLLIDQIWARDSILSQVFSISNPESKRLSLVNQNLALYYRSNSDWKNNYYILGVHPEKQWLDHFKVYHKIDESRILLIDSEPYYTDSWCREFELYKNSINFEEFIFSGISQLEEKILGIYGKNPSIEEREFKKLNSKNFIFEASQDLKIKFPVSELISGKELTNFLMSDASENFKFKALLSSGGSGQFTNTKLKSLLLWSQRNNWLQKWEQAIWLKQQKLSPLREFSYFGHTDSAEVQIVEVAYDINSLSLFHNFTPAIDETIKSNFVKTFKNVSQYLQNCGYQGPFGIDAMQTEENLFYCVDLNVRVTKTHLLSEILKQWPVAFQYRLFYRHRFINQQKNFLDYWQSICQSNNLNNFGEGIDVQVFPVEVSAWAQGLSEVTFLITLADKEKFNYIIENIKRI